MNSPNDQPEPAFLSKPRGMGVKALWMLIGGLISALVHLVMFGQPTSDVSTNIGAFVGGLIGPFLIGMIFALLFGSAAGLLAIAAFCYLSFGSEYKDRKDAFRAQ